MDTYDRLEGDRLLTLLGEQRDHYRRLRALSERQRGIIAGDRPEQLLEILGERQTLIAGLMKINEQLAPFRRSWDSMYGQLPEKTRLQASTLLAEINESLRVILKTDQEDSALLSARRQSVSLEMNTLAGARSANSAYARHPAPSAPTLAGADVSG